MSSVYPVTDPNLVEIGSNPSEVQVDETTQVVESTTQESPVEVVTGGAQVYTAGIQGPPGPAGGEEEMAYAERVDFISATLLYRGEAVPGTLESEAKWRIRRITIGADKDTTTEWADGDADFNNVWDDRLSLNYI